MSFFGADYEKAGVGVAKNAPKKKPFFDFWDLYGRRFWKMLQLNMLTFLFCIPIVSIGPAIAGMTRVLRIYALDKNAFIWHDFWKGFSENWKQSLPIGLIDILSGVSLFCALQVYPALAEASENSFLYYLLCAISVGFVLTILMMNFYAFPMIVATDLSFKNIIKNSFFLTCIGLKKNILTLVIVMVICVLTFVSVLVSSFSLLLIPIWTITFVGFIIVYNSYPLIQKYVIDPFYAAQGKDNPEYDYLKPMDDEEALFTDKGGEEKPIESQKKKKGKTIS
ncbi:MAG: YesL family protein [Huintestinicola sp.]